MHEFNPNQSSSIEAQIYEGLEQLAASLDYMDALPDDAPERAKLGKALCQVIDGHVQNNPIMSGGETIPGTDEWIPGKRTDSYSYVTEDKDTGATYAVLLPTAFGRRLEDFARQNRPKAPEEQAPAAATDEATGATVLSFAKSAQAAKGKSSGRARKAAGPAARTAEEHTSTKNGATQNHPKVTKRQRGGARRPQTAPKAGRPETPDVTQPLGHEANRGRNASHKRDVIGDLVKLDTTGRAHYQSGAVEHVRDQDGQAVQQADGSFKTRRIGGHFMTKHELDMIESNQDVIRDGLADRWAIGTEELTKPDGFSAAAWNKLTDDERQRAANLWQAMTDDEKAQAFAPTADFQNPVAQMNDETRQVYFDNARQAEQTTSGEAPAVRQTLLQRIKRGFKHAGRQLYLAPQHVRNAVSKAGDYLADQEKGRRRGIAAGVVGVVAVGAAYYGMKYGGDLFGHTGHVSAAGGGSSSKDLIDALNGRGPGAGHGNDPGFYEAIQGQGAGHELLHLSIHRGDMPWDVLQRAGVPGQQIMHHLNEAAKNSGLDFAWHGTGEQRWLEVAGKSDTKSVIQMLKPFLVR